MDIDVLFKVYILRAQVFEYLIASSKVFHPQIQKCRDRLKETKQLTNSPFCEKLPSEAKDSSSREKSCLQM